MRTRQRPALKKVRRGMVHYAHNTIGTKIAGLRAHAAGENYGSPANIAALLLIGAYLHVTKVNREPMFIRAAKAVKIMEAAEKTVAHDRLIWVSDSDFHQ